MDSLQHNRRLGVFFFVIYLAFYAAFVAIAAYDYKLLGRTAFGGMNWAVVGGFGLILAAFVLALAYAFLARNEPNED